MTTRSRLKKAEKILSSIRSDKWLTVEEIRDRPGYFKGRTEQGEKIFTEEELEAFDGTVIKIVWKDMAINKPMGRDHEY